jgi:hypothetical protein
MMLRVFADFVFRAVESIWVAYASFIEIIKEFKAFHLSRLT